MKQEYYTKKAAEVIKLLKSDEIEGLSSSEAHKRLLENGKNSLPEKKKQSNIIKFLKHFNDVLIYVLFAAAIVTAFLEHYLDTIVILVVAVINASIGFFQEKQAEKSLEGIRKLLANNSNVIRDGNRIEIPSEDLVVGDLVILSPGDKVPADMRLIKAENLNIEESALTGESVPSEKKVTELDPEIGIGDQINMAFSGTSVSSGTGLGIITATSAQTEIGKINQMMNEVEAVSTPLLRQTARFGKTVSLVIVVVAFIIYLFGHFYRHYNEHELLLSVIGLAVAAIPEGLPAILSIILAIGVQNMAKKNAIIRTLPSVETLGSVTVICSDKTGTLTKNEMTVKEIITTREHFTVTETGYHPVGEILLHNEKIILNKEPVLKELIQCFRTCNDAGLIEDADGQWRVSGDPMEGALLTLSYKSGGKLETYERLTTLPFDSEYKYMATMIPHQNEHLIYIKGAPEKLLAMAREEETLEGTKPIEVDYWENQIQTLANKGMRLLGAAYKKAEKGQKEVTHEDIDNGIVFLGIVGIIDPPREEAISSIQSCKSAGIQVKMITGDHMDTAKAIGKELGIGDGQKAIQGVELDKMSPLELQRAAMEHHIFARTSPENKLNLVKAIQANGEICAMTGDGVNDAPALKRADVGIAMGIKGTEVTKDAAEMVLVDDNFSTIVNAVAEGRRVYDNLKKTILFILPTNGAESFLIIASILFGTLMPLTPLQILWVNMVTSITVSLALAFENMEKDAMQRPPRSPKEPLLNKYFIWRILFVSVLIGGSTLLLNVHLLNKGYSHDLVRTITLQTIVIAQMFHLFNSRSIRDFAFNKNFFSNKVVFIVCGLLIVLQLFATYVPFMNHLFTTIPLSLENWRYPFIIGISVFIIVEIEKFVVKKLAERK